MRKPPTTGWLTERERATHVLIVGQPGTGKTKAIEPLILQDILAGRGVGMIDVHGDLSQHLRIRLAQVAQRVPGLAGKVVILDPTDAKWAVGFNPLQATDGLPPERLAWLLADVVMKIWGVVSNSAPRMVWLLINTFLALSELGLTLVDAPRFLRDPIWRDSLIHQLSNSQARRYFEVDFPKTEAAINQWVQPVINKLGALVFDPDARAILGQRQSTISFRKIMDDRLIFLANLPKGVMGEENNRLLAAFLVALFQQAALSRADTIERKPFYLYLDEFQNYTTDNVKDVLSESRKYRLSLTMAHQYLGQLDGNLRQAVLNTVGTIIAFRVGYHDGLELVKEMFPIPITVSHKELSFWSLGVLPFPYFEEETEKLSLAEVAGRLTRLQTREFWMKKRGVLWPTRHRTPTVPDPILTPETREAVGRLVAFSGRRYGRAKADVMRELERPDVPLLQPGELEREEKGTYYD